MRDLWREVYHSRTALHVRLLNQVRLALWGCYIYVASVHSWMIIINFKDVHVYNYIYIYYNKHDKRLDYICCPTSSSSAAFLYLINLIHLQVAFIVCKIIIIKQSHFDFRRRCLALITIIGHVITCE